MANQASESEWPHCPPGELQRVAGAVRARRARRHTWRAAGTAAAAVFVLLVAVIGVRTLQTGGASGDMYFGGISCTEVHNLAPGFMAGTVDEQDAARIRAHLAECPMCRKMLENMGAKSARAGLDPGGTVTTTVAERGRPSATTGRVSDRRGGSAETAARKSSVSLVAAID